MLALCGWSIAAPAEAATSPDPGSVTVAMLARGTTPKAIANASDRFALGLLSAGLGSVPSDQTYLDISQGNRLFDSLYPEPIPPLFVRDGEVPRLLWREAVERAREAPAQIVPGLLGGELRRAGLASGALREAQSAALIAATPTGSVGRPSGCRIVECPGLTVIGASRVQLRRLVARLQGDDLLIALEEAPPAGRLLSIGIAGRGFSGLLSSPTTRLDGYVVSTDLAPTILDRYGLAIPEEMNGRVIDSVVGGSPSELASLRERLEEVSTRRHPVIGVNLLIWAGLALAAALLWPGRGAAIGVRTLAVTVAWVPALLLLTAALEPSQAAERLIIGLAAPALAVASQIGLRGWFGERSGFAAFALAASVSVLATAVDVLAGSSLTAVSLIGPNPALGVRFFGIGNELEAVIGTLLALGSGAWVAALRPAQPAKAVAVTASVAALIGVIVFAPSSFGADVGAAITFPAAAAGVVLAALGAGRRRVVLVVAAPLGAVGALIAIDLAIGGDAHLTRSVLEAGGLEQFGEVIERRVRLGAASYQRFFESFFFAAALLAIVAGLLARRQIFGWFEALPAARAGLVGGIAAATVGALANDSGALLLMIGAAYVAAFAGLAWEAQCFTSDSKSR